MRGGDCRGLLFGEYLGERGEAYCSLPWTYCPLMSRPGDGEECAEAEAEVAV